MIRDERCIDIISNKVAMFEITGKTFKDLSFVFVEEGNEKSMIDIVPKDTKIKDLKDLPMEAQLFIKIVLGQDQNPFKMISLESLVDFDEAKEPVNVDFDNMKSKLSSLGVNVVTNINDLPADMPEELKEMLSTMFGTKQEAPKEEVKQTPKYENNFDWDDAEIECIVESQVGHKNYKCFKGLEMVVCQIKTGKIITEIIIDRNYEIKDIRIKR